MSDRRLMLVDRKKKPKQKKPKTKQNQKQIIKNLTIATTKKTRKIQ